MAIGFPTYGLLCPFCFSLRHPWSICFLWASLSLLLTLHSHGLLLTSLGFPGPITSFSSLGFIGLPLTPYFCACVTLGLQWSNLIFLYHMLPMGMLFLSFRASLSPLASSRPICLFYGPVIHYFCLLGLIVLPSVCQFFAALVVGLSSSYLDSHKWPSTHTMLSLYLLGDNIL